MVFSFDDTWYVLCTMKTRIKVCENYKAVKNGLVELNSVLGPNSFKSFHRIKDIQI